MINGQIHISVSSNNQMPYRQCVSSWAGWLSRWIYGRVKGKWFLLPLLFQCAVCAIRGCWQLRFSFHKWIALITRHQHSGHRWFPLTFDEFIFNQIASKFARRLISVNDRRHKESVVKMVEKCNFFIGKIAQYCHPLAWNSDEMRKLKSRYEKRFRNFNFAKFLRQANIPKGFTCSEDMKEGFWLGNTSIFAYRHRHHSSVAPTFSRCVAQSNNIIPKNDYCRQRKRYLAICKRRKM